MSECSGTRRSLASLHHHLTRPLAARSQQLLDFLLKRLKKDNVHVKLKVLRVFKLMRTMSQWEDQNTAVPTKVFKLVRLLKFTKLVNDMNLVKGNINFTNEIID